MAEIRRNQRWYDALARSVTGNRLEEMLRAIGKLTGSKEEKAEVRRFDADKAMSILGEHFRTVSQSVIIENLSEIMLYRYESALDNEKETVREEFLNVFGFDIAAYKKDPKGYLEKRFPETYHS